MLLLGKIYYLRQKIKMVDRLANTEENNRRMKHVEDCFGTSGQSLTKVGRVLVGEGVLTKLCRKKPKPRQYANQHILPLQEVKIITLEDEGNFKNGWQIISPSKSFAVYAATPTEKAEWMAHINKCINDLLKKTGTRPSGEEAAVWVPDQSANICMVCQKTKFSALVRKHHCRRCGSVVCGNCSTKRYMMPHISQKHVRVCDQCYDQMSSGAVKPDDPVLPASSSNKMKTESGSLSRDDSEKLAESGSSAEESDGGDDAEETEQPTFYEKSDEPARPSNPPATSQ